MCNKLSDKASKGRFLKSERLQITVTKEKERSERKSEGRKGREERREKSNGCTPSFYNSYLSSIFR